MKLCVPIPCFFGGTDFKTAVKTVSELGYTAIEAYDYSQFDFETVKSVCSEYGVRFLSICTSEFNMTNPEKRNDYIEGIKKSCKAAKAMGVDHMITQVGADTGAERAYQHQAISDTLKLAKPILEDYDITLMIEPLNTLYNHRGYYLPSSGEGFELVREADSKNIKLVFDIYHQQISEGNIIPNILDNLDLIAHLHSAGHPGRHELQLGENNYGYIFEQIDEAGYTGYCGLEYSPTMDAVESLKIAMELYGKSPKSRE